jgi:hypothetical protein
VQDGLKEITDAIQKIRDSVKYFRGSQMRKQSFLQAVSQMSLDSNKGFRQDVPTRWNLTYFMLESAIHYRRAYAYLEMTDKNYMFCHNALEWEKMNDISSFLGCFYRSTCVFFFFLYQISHDQSILSHSCIDLSELEVRTCE